MILRHLQTIRDKAYVLRTTFHNLTVHIILHVLGIIYGRSEEERYFGEVGSKPLRRGHFYSNLLLWDLKAVF